MISCGACESSQSSATSATSAAMASDYTLSREEAITALESLCREVVRSLGSGEQGSVNLFLTAPAHDGAPLGDATEIGPGIGGERGLHRLNQVWTLIPILYEIAVKGKKLTQRELWYRLKPSGEFASPDEVNMRVLDVCAMVSEGCRSRCPRSALGIIASPRGYMTGSTTLLLPSGAQQSLALDDFVYPIPGDPEEIAELRFASSRARCVLVVEKESVFRRLIDDGLTAKLPCLLITACGFPDMATRAMVRHALDELGLPVFVLTDWNPHGLLLMLCYKHGSMHAGLNGHQCPSLQWLGLTSADTMRPLPASLFSGGAEHAVVDAERRRVPRRDLQPYTKKDLSILEGLKLRHSVQADAALMREVAEMGVAQVKVEIEALSCAMSWGLPDDGTPRGFDDGFLTKFLVQKVVVQLPLCVAQPA